jgi:hypothetical protein
MAWPRTDVRRQRPWRGAKLSQKPKGARSHPGATGEGQTGRAKNLNLR